MPSKIVVLDLEPLLDFTGRLRLHALRESSLQVGVEVEVPGRPDIEKC